MALDASAKLCIFWYLILLGFFGLCIWRKFRYRRRPILLSPFIFVPLVGGICALITSMLGVILLPLALELSTGIVVGFIHPIFAASFFLTTFIIKPWELLPSNEFMAVFPRSLAALAFSSLFAHVAFNRSKHIFYNGGVALFFCFIGWVFLSSLTAYNSTESIAAFVTEIFPIIATFLLILNTSSERIDIEVIRGGLIIAVLSLTSIAIVRTLWSWGFDFSSAIPRLEGEGQWANANDLAALMVLVLPLLYFPLVARSYSLWNKFFGLILVAFLLFGIWISQSRAAILAVAIGVLSHYLTRRKLQVKVLFPILAAILVPIIFFSTIRRNESDISGSNSMRLEYFMAGVRMLKTSPLTGVGFNNYAPLFERFSTNFEEFGKRTAHSSWVLAMAETGLPGLALLLSLFLFVLNRAYSLRFIQPEQFVAIVSYGICMTFLSHTYEMAPYVLFAWILSSKRLLT